MPKCTRREFAAAGGALLAPLGTQAAPAPKTPTDLLSRSVSLEKVGSMLEPRERWRPFPVAADRAAWEALSAETRQALVAGGERALKGDWPGLPATLFLEFRRTG